jgi:hypothetical protein
MQLFLLYSHGILSGILPQILWIKNIRYIEMYPLIVFCI